MSLDNESGRSDSTSIAASAALMGAVLILHGVAYFRFHAWLWGADTLYALAGGSAIAALAFTALLLVPGVSRLAMRPLASAGRNRFVSLFGDKVVAAFLAGGLSLALLWRMGVSDPAGKGWLFHSPYIPAHGGAAAAARGLPVPIDLLAGGLSALVGASEPLVSRGLCVLFGVALICLVVLYPFRCREKGRGASAALLLAVSGAMLVFLSSRTDLALEVLATAAFLTLSARALEDGLSPVPAGVAAWCAALAHPIGLSLLPAWAFLVWSGSRGARRGKALIALLASSAAVLIALAVLDLAGHPALGAFWSDVGALWLTGSGARAGWVLKWIGEGGAAGSVLMAAGWLAERVWGTFNGVLLAAPAGFALALAAVFTRGWRSAGRTGAFMGLAALSTAIFAFLSAPQAGAPRAWGIFAPAGLCLTAFGAWWLMWRVGEGRSYRAVALGATVLSLVHLLPAFYVSADPEVGAENLAVNASSPSPWDVRGRADALEQLSALHLAQGDTLAAARLLDVAWGVRPNPLYLGVAGTYYASANRYSLAEREFARLVAARPDDVEANLSLGILHAVRRDMEGAKGFLLAAYGDTTLSLPEPEMDSSADWENMPKGPEREELIRTRANKRLRASKIFLEGDHAARQGLLNAAAREYRQALAVYPRWGKMQFEVHCHRGTIRAMQGRFREAAYELLLGINSYRNYATCYYIVNGVGYGPVRPTVSRFHAPLSAE